MPISHCFYTKTPFSVWEVTASGFWPRWSLEFRRLTLHAYRAKKLFVSLVPHFVPALPQLTL